MADIAMCSGDGCSTKQNCYRFTAPINEYAQSYFAKVPGKDQSCEYFGKDENSIRIYAIANRIWYSVC